MEELAEGLFSVGRFVIGGTCQVVGGLVEHTAEHVAGFAADVMDAHGIPGSDLVRDHAAFPFELVGHGLSEMGKLITEE
jgi:hypothetical protein